jgi:hypothetical protein
VASTSGLTSINGDFNLSTSGGELDLGGTLNVVGNLTLTTGTTLNAQSSNINLGGNWSLGGTFIAGSGTVTFNGAGAQSVNQTTFNNLTVNKASGTLTFLGDLGVNGNIDVQAGTVDISTFTITRAVPGGLLTFGATAVVRAGGAVFQISNFTAFSAHPSSTVEFYGSSTRPIPPVIYGNLIISDAGAKIMIGPTTVAGNLTINTGATLVLPTSTLNLGGNLSNSGTLDASPGTLILNGTGKTISGGFTAKELIVNGEYNVVSGNHTINDNIEISTTGDLDLGTTTITVHGNMTNSGILFSGGIATFSGLQPQTIQLNNAISSTSTGVVNFNGTVAPILNSTSSPTLSTVNINNTASIVPSQPWVVGVAMTIASGATWDAGPFDHVMGGNFTNNGTVTSTGKITFNPNPPFPSVTVTLGNNFTTTGTVDFSGTVPIILVDNTPTFNFVSITNTDASGITAATNWMVSQNLFIGPGSVFNGGTGLTHNVSGNWTNNGIFTGATSTIIFDSNAGTDEITGAGLNNFYNVTFDPGTSMEVVSDISIAQDFTNNATSLDLLSVAVTFTGTTLSAIGGVTPSAFHELIINKSANGVRLDQDASIDNLLSLTSGLFDLNANTLSVTNSSANAISRSTGYLLSENTMFNGRLSWSIGTDFDPHVVPFGNSSADYIPFTFDLSSGDAGVVTLATYATPSNNLPLPPGVNHVKDVLGVDNSINTVDRFFLIELSGETTPTADITLSASAAEVGSITTLLGQRWNGTFWDTPLPGQLSGATSVTVPGVTQFSPWAISGNSTPLPITLLNFSAIQIDHRVALEWSTASEINNDYFEVEKSVDGVSFNVIGKVNGAINSTETRTYNFSDFELKKGRSFYRLKQIDLDKKFTYSPIVTVMVGEITTTNISFNVYPNPTVETLFITHTGVVNNSVIVSIFDGSGKLVSRNANKVGVNDGPLELDVRDMKPGYYVIQAIAGGKSTSFRILKME